MDITISRNVPDTAELRGWMDQAADMVRSELGPYAGAAHLGWNWETGPAGPHSRLRMSVFASVQCDIVLEAADRTADPEPFRRRFRREWSNAVRAEYGYPPLPEDGEPDAAEAAAEHAASV